MQLDNVGKLIMIKTTTFCMRNRAVTRMQGENNKRPACTAKVVAQHCSCKNCNNGKGKDKKALHQKRNDVSYTCGLKKVQKKQNVRCL